MPQPLTLTELGFRADPGDAKVARIAEDHGWNLRLLSEDGERIATLSGSVKHAIREGTGLRPAVGDFVEYEPAGDGAVIRHVLPRHSAFTRKVVDQRHDAQVVAANVDTVFLVMGLDRDFSPRRLERYLTMAFESGATPVVVLNKKDLHEPDDLALLESLAVESSPGVERVSVSALTSENIDQLRRWLSVGQTVALLGSSGVGKSTLINRLVGEDLLDTGQVRLKDGRGRHTTTTRQLVPVPGGGLLLDTPGMRELQVIEADEGLARAFEDITTLASQCRFKDCSHEGEPGCAVQAALDDGTLPDDRYDAWRQLQREMAYEARRSNKLAKNAAHQREKESTRALNRFQRHRRDFDE